MDRLQFLNLLKDKNIDYSVVVFDDPIRDGYCVRKNYFRWEVFFRERGEEYNILGFPSESDALEKLYEILVKMYSG